MRLTIVAPERAKPVWLLLPMSVARPVNMALGVPRGYAHHRNKMGTAGLDVKRLAGLLERMKANCILIDDDAALDHCVLRISSIKRPGVVAYVEYENIAESRLVGMVVKPEHFQPEREDYPLEWEREMQLKGSRKEDPEQIAAWIKRDFLEAERRGNKLQEKAA
jgi:hypothetical protein